MIIDGNAIAQKLKVKIKDDVGSLNFQPVFCDVLVGEDPVSAAYVNMKARACEEMGMKFLRAEYSSAISQRELESEIEKINLTPNLCGLIIQLPLPTGLNNTLVCNKIASNLDIDCLSQKNTELFYSGKLNFIPPTPGAVLEVLDNLDLDLKNLKILMVGQGELVGRPVSFLLKQRGVNVQVADKTTKDAAALAKKSDVIITATGQANLITADWVKPGAVVIDAGAAELDGAITGDVDFESVKDIAGYITPVPGGVGPLTVTKLLQNVLDVARSKVQ
jgi:methylenetetrahydrofolate dehydrogenase (NADP+)/methenyltetrahydrofolate cyclohydrolase